MNIPLVDLRRQYFSIKDEIDTAIKEVIENSSFIMGEKVSSFEKSFSEFCNVKHAIGCSNGTVALQLALKSLNLGEDDEIITVPNTFIATTEAITSIGAKIKFVDVGKDYLIDVDKIEEAITKRTKAVIPVHLYGQMVDMDIIKEIAEKHNLFVIEDSAQANGAEYKGKKPGIIGDVATFSFFPAKNLGAFGDAGAVVTNNEEIAEKISLWVDHGRKTKYVHLVEGYNYRLHALQAAILNTKLKYLNKWNEHRRKNARLYNELLKNVIIPVETKYNKHVYYTYVIRAGKRDILQQKLKENGISTGVYYPIPLHLQPAYSYLNLKEGSFPLTESYAKSILSLPMFPELQEEEIKFIAEKVNSLATPYTLQ